MTAPRPVTAPAMAATARVLTTRVFVRALRIDAEIGVYTHERGRHQPLLVDVELDVATADWRSLGDTVNYETIADLARTIAADGHIGLVETFAHRLAEACLVEPRVSRARVRIEKPMALAPAAAAAGVEIIVARG